MTETDNQSEGANILIVDDEQDIRELIADILGDEGHETRMARNAEEAFNAINAAAPDLIILDIWLKGSHMDGIDILKSVSRDNPDVPVVIISGHGNVEIAVAAVKQGAYDFIQKPFNIDQLILTASRALEASTLRREVAKLKDQDVTASEMIGSGVAMRNLKAQLAKVARTNSRVLLTGPSGCGKELAARYIHQNSDRAEGPFISVSAASIRSDNMEQVLFGREFADKPHDPGLFERAHRGTIFFDEVADMPIGTQSKILRVLLDQHFTREGGADTVRVDVRVISASNRNLVQEIEFGRFRQDLYHRLNVVPIEIPGLDARCEDIPELFEHFVRDFNTRNGLPIRALSDDALAVLQTTSWQGHVRQFRNMIERALIMGDENTPIQAEELPSPGAADDGGRNEALNAALSGMPLREAREVFEREYLIAQINRFGGNISRTAKFVGMERSALHRKLKSLNVVTTSRGGARMAALEDTE